MKRDEPFAYPNGMLAPQHREQPQEPSRRKWSRFRAALAALVVIAVIALVLGILPFGAWAEADVFDAAAIAGAAGDIVTTELALKRGFVEQNIQQRGPRIGANVLLTGACLISGRELDKQGHRGWAKAVKLVPAVVFGGFAIKNAITMREAR